MNWKLCLAVLTCNVLFMSSSYTMIIPFLPVYLTKELGVIPADIHLWSGIIFSASFIVSSVMAPIWGRWLTIEENDSWHYVPAFYYQSVIFSEVSYLRRFNSHVSAYSKVLLPDSGP